MHPPLTAFPFPLLTIVVLLEAFSFIKDVPAFRSVIRFNLIFAGVAVICAFFSGYQASELANQTFTVSDEVIAQHHNWGRVLLFLIVPCVALRFIADRAAYNKRIFAYVYYFFLAVCYSLVVLSGYLGAQLVFVHGAAVSSVP